MEDIIILGGARDYHAIDWYRTVKKISNRNVYFLTDMISAEGYDVIINDTDDVSYLYNIDWLLFSSQTKVGNLWRNFIKVMVLPMQIYYLRMFMKKHPNAVVNAHPMYYMFLCWISKVEYIGTPQGSEILVRPQKSFLYKFFTKKILSSAKAITIDSLSMHKGIKCLSGVNSYIIQNGIDFDILNTFNKDRERKIDVLSIRGMTDLYRIEELIINRNQSKLKPPISFIYPFGEDGYIQKIKNILLAEDELLGRLSKNDMYELLTQSKLVISIPRSDSSPRSVYEAIFLGCCVAVTYNTWIEDIPECMKKRLYIVDLKNISWLDEALEYAEKIVEIKYIPSPEAIDMFDQNVSISKLIDLLY